MRKEDVLAILLADIHLSLNPPVWRSNEPDWLNTQRQKLYEIQELQIEYNKCPILCAGDVFNWWDSKAELINFAMTYLPDDMYCIPGQHDLPRHRLEDINKSAFQTLANLTIHRLQPNIGWLTNDMVVWGFPYGVPIEPVDEKYKRKGIIQVALVHEYAWIKGHSYPNASHGNMIGRKPAKSKNVKWYGYDVIVYGDNHSGFLTKYGATTIFNCGTLMRRASDEENYRPQVGLLLKDGSVVPHYLDISRDKHLTKAEEKIKTKELDIKAFFSELEKLGDSILDFKKALLRATNDKQVKEILIEAMEKKQKRDE